MLVSLSDKRGFTLIEVIIVIAIVAILAGIIAPIVYRETTQARYKRAESELEAIYEAIVGDGKSYFGFLGDIGRLPDNLTELYVDPGISQTECPSGSGISIGWKGPYLSAKNVDSSGIIDPFGNYYQQEFQQVGGTSHYRWRLHCLCNPSDSSDDLYYPDEPIDVVKEGTHYTIYSSMRGEAKVSGVSYTPKNIAYTVYYPSPSDSSCAQSSQKNTGLITGIPSGKRFISFWFYKDDGSATGTPIAEVFNFYVDEFFEIKREFSSIQEALTVSSLSYTENSNPSGCTANFSIEIESSLNVSGFDPLFFVYLEGYNKNGEKIIGPFRLNKRLVSPHFYYSSTDFVCGLSYIRVFSEGGGASLVRNL